MGKSRAEIQKAYRERKKAKLGSVYLEKEVQRVQKYYKPTCSLRQSELQDRRERVRESVRKHREHAKNSGLSATSSATPEETAPIIKFAFNDKSFKRRMRELRQARKKINDLEKRLSVAERKKDQLRKRIERSGKESNIPTLAASEASSEEMTPRTRTNVQIRSAGLTPR